MKLNKVGPLTQWRLRADVVLASECMSHLVSIKPMIHRDFLEKRRPPQQSCRCSCLPKANVSDVRIKKR